MRTAVLIASVFMLFPAQFARADIIDVPGDQPSIQAGIDAASDGDTVLVAPGTYKENLIFPGKVVSVISRAGPESTVIDGSGLDTVVTFKGGENANSVLEGFTITNGYALYGGGIYCWDGSRPLIKGNIVSMNTAESSGGGIYCNLYSAPEILYNTVSENKTTINNQYSYGGGIYDDSVYRRPVVGNRIINNTGHKGGGISFGFFSKREFRDNQVTGNHADKGGGIFAWVTADLVIEGNTLCDNSADSLGGGGYFEAVHATIENNFIQSNSAPSGGGIHCEQGFDPFSMNILNNRIIGNCALVGSGGGINAISNKGTNIRNNLIVENNAPMGSGGGIRCASSDAQIVNNRIFRNTASSGGGIDCIGSYPVMTGNILAANEAVHYGGGLFLSGGSAPIISNSLFYANRSGSRGGGLCTFQLCAPVIVNSIFRENSALQGEEIFIGDVIEPTTIWVSYSNIMGAQSRIQVEPGCILWWGAGMIDADPLFVDAEGYDFHLTYDSPCRDAGDNAAVAEPVDVEGDPRIAWDGTVDMGADEFHTHLYHTGDTTPGGEVRGMLVGQPGTWPVALVAGAGILEEPLDHLYGDLWLSAPWRIFPLLEMPSSGVLVLPWTIPPELSTPWALPIQGLVGLEPDSLTNLSVLKIR